MMKGQVPGRSCRCVPRVVVPRGISDGGSSRTTRLLWRRGPMQCHLPRHRNDDAATATTTTTGRTTSSSRSRPPFPSNSIRDGSISSSHLDPKHRHRHPIATTGVHPNDDDTQTMRRTVTRTATLPRRPDRKRMRPIVGHCPWVRPPPWVLGVRSTPRPISPPRVHPAKGPTWGSISTSARLTS